ncbi:aminoglycoside phosphotransferase family protein [Litorivivens sp.]|uniref:aminoglycoside phosphotransferase family protein n=1 Tax=Litorivivens sp. TaxID=2020868 RepID=UPI003568BC42
MLNNLRQWCAAELCLPESALGELLPVAGDASFRRYFRLRPEQQPSVIVMDAPPDKEDSAPFLDIAGRLQHVGIHAPRILAHNLQRGWILLEDLGDTLYKSAFEQRPGSQVMAEILPVLEKLTLVDTARLPQYDEGRLQQELDLFPQWHLAVHTKQEFTAAEQMLWQQLCGQLIDNANAQPAVFVHRDLHSCNLMEMAGKAPGVIDFQDAVLGPITYDLMSILLDRYITWPRPQLEEWMEAFRLRVAPDVPRDTWRRWCDWMGLQRNLKIIGIFARLAYRDGKTGYLSLVPRFSDYVRDVLYRYNELEPYQELLEPRL